MGQMTTDDIIGTWIGRMNIDKNNLKICEDQFNQCHQCLIKLSEDQFDQCHQCSNKVILQADDLLKNIETDKFISLPINQLR
jgi:hypothetical protein